MQYGTRGEQFRVGVLATRKCLSVEGIIQCCSGLRSSNGTIIVGRVLEQSKKPYLLVINRGSAAQTVVGPNRMGYVPEDGEYRVCIPEEYQGKILSQILPNSIIEIIMTRSDDQSFIYGSGSDYMAGPH
jgi:hypothetical protein